jgi:hypothetical protein
MSQETSTYHADLLFSRLKGLNFINLGVFSFLQSLFFPADLLLGLARLVLQHTLLRFPGLLTNVAANF